jgi:Domain of unknown function (DUF4345)
MLKLLLRMTSFVYFLVGVTHLALGVGADSLLGANLDATTLSNATLDSQSRFYGASFGASGVLLWIAADKSDFWKTVINCLMLALFVGGVARLVSIANLGLPSPLALILLATELVMPALIVTLLNRKISSV